MTIKERYNELFDGYSLPRWKLDFGKLERLVSEAEALESQLAAVTAERDAWKRIRTPTHGPCCTCQACGLDYDTCRCDLDDLADQLTTLRAAAERALAVLPGLEVRNWPPGHAMKKDAIEALTAALEGRG